MITAQATMSRSSSSRTRKPPDTCDSPVTERGDTSLVPNLTACSIAARVSSAPETPPGKTEVGGIQLTGLSQVSGAPGACCSGAVQARWVAAGRGRNGPGGLGLRVDDQVAGEHRTVPDGEFEEAVEDHASAGRAAAVEAEGELVQVAVQVRLVHRALVRAQQLPERV